MESRCCRYLRGSPLVCMSEDRLGKQLLSLFMWFSPCLHVWEEPWKADFVSIYVVLPLSACLRIGLESRFCRYLRGSPLVCMSEDRFVNQLLSLFPWFSLCLHGSPLVCMSGKIWEVTWKADFVSIYVASPLYASLGKTERRGSGAGLPRSWFGGPRA